MRTPEISASSGPLSNKSVAETDEDVPPQASDPGSSSTRRLEASVSSEPLFKRSFTETASSVAPPASPRTAARNTSTGAVSPLQALLGDTQPKMARPHPRLAQPVSSGQTARQGIATRAAPGEIMCCHHLFPFALCKAIPIESCMTLDKDSSCACSFRFPAASSTLVRDL